MNTILHDFIIQNNKENILEDRISCSVVSFIDPERWIPEGYNPLVKLCDRYTEANRYVSGLPRSSTKATPQFPPWDILPGKPCKLIRLSQSCIVTLTDSERDNAWKQSTKEQLKSTYKMTDPSPVYKVEDLYISRNHLMRIFAREHSIDQVSSNEAVLRDTVDRHTGFYKA